MKKLVLIASVLFFCVNIFAQSITLSNGGFENGNLVKGIKDAVEGNDWFWQAVQNKVPGSTVSLSTDEKHDGNTSLKITASGEIAARYNVSIAKVLGLIPTLKYNLVFYAKSNQNVILNCFYNGTIIKDGESKQTLTPGDVINIKGDNKWNKYTLQLKGKMFSGGGNWDFLQLTTLNIGLEKQSLEADLELYLDDLELSDSK